MINRRLVLRGLIAAPAVVAIGSLMPIRGIIMPVGHYGGMIRSAEQMAIYKRIREGYIAGGIWDKIDALWLFGGAQTEEEARTDFISGRRLP